MSALIVAVKSPAIVMPSRLIVLKPGEREGDRVDARAQIHEAVLAAAVRDDGASLLDERRALRLDRHARQHRAGGVLTTPVIDAWP